MVVRRLNLAPDNPVRLAMQGRLDRVLDMNTVTDHELPTDDDVEDSIQEALAPVREHLEVDRTHK